MFVVKNRELFKLNSDIHHTGTRYNNDLHLPSTHLNLFQKGVYYSGIKIYRVSQEECATLRESVPYV